VINNARNVLAAVKSVLLLNIYLNVSFMLFIIIFLINNFIYIFFKIIFNFTHNVSTLYIFYSISNFIILKIFLY